MVGVAYAGASIAQTLMSLMPVFMIPVIWVIYKEKTNRHGTAGAILAVVEVAILFLT
jgi:drug/metabolite transporter (DMT)-like permease